MSFARPEVNQLFLFSFAAVVRFCALRSAQKEDPIKEFKAPRAWQMTQMYPFCARWFQGYGFGGGGCQALPRRKKDETRSLKVTFECSSVVRNNQPNNWFLGLTWATRPWRYVLVWGFIFRKKTNQRKLRGFNLLEQSIQYSCLLIQIPDGLWRFRSKRISNWLVTPHISLHALYIGKFADVLDQDTCWSLCAADQNSGVSIQRIPRSSCLRLSGVDKLRAFLILWLHGDRPDVHKCKPTTKCDLHAVEFLKICRQPLCLLDHLCGEDHVPWDAPFCPYFWKLSFQKLHRNRLLLFGDLFLFAYHTCCNNVWSVFCPMLSSKMAEAQLDSFSWTTGFVGWALTLFAEDI